MTKSTLASLHLLIVEDDFFLAQDKAVAFQALGADVFGTVASIDDALDLMDRTEALDGALLDLNLQGQMS